MIVNVALDAIWFEHCAGPWIRARAGDGVLLGQLLTKFGFKQLLLLFLYPPEGLVSVMSEIIFATIEMIGECDEDDKIRL